MSGAVYEQTPSVLDAPLVVRAGLRRDPNSQSTAGASKGNHPTFTRRWLRCNDEGVQCGVTSPVVTTSTYPVTAADLGYTFRIEITAQVVDSFQTRTKTVNSAPVTRGGRSMGLPDTPDCTALKHRRGRPAEGEGRPEGTGRREEDRQQDQDQEKARKKLTAAKAALKKAQAAATAGGC